MIGLRNKPGFSRMRLNKSFKGNCSILTSSCCKTFDLVNIISQVSFSVMLYIPFISSKDCGSLYIFPSVYFISCSSYHAFAFMQAVQLGELQCVILLLHS